MPYLLLAIGALMSVAGAYSIITGSHIVQVEAGWTSVIAGATLFAGGILTMALGLVLRVLLQLRKALVSGPVKMPSPAPVAEDVFEPEPLAAEATTPIEYLPAAADPVMPPTPLEPALRQENVPAPLGRVLPTAPKLPLKLEPRLDNWRKPKRQPEKDIAPKDAVPQDLAPKEDLLPSLMPVPPAAVAVATPEPAATRPAAPIDDNFVPADEVAHSSDDYRLETPSTPEHDLGPGLPDIPPPAPKVPAPKLPASPQLEDDWLDRAFAEFDHDIPKKGPADGGDTLLKPPPQPQSNTVAPTLTPTHPEPEPNFEPAYEDLEPEPVDVAQAAPATAAEPGPVSVSDPPPAGAGSAVIGRYESDGTTYVMYADGSIEAQSESGVYRFASMSELKAFIES